MSPDLTAVLSDALAPVLQQLLRPDEIDRVTLQRNESAVWDQLSLRGDDAQLWVWTEGRPR